MLVDRCVVIRSRSGEEYSGIWSVCRVFKENSHSGLGTVTLRLFSFHLIGLGAAALSCSATEKMKN